MSKRFFASAKFRMKLPKGLAGVGGGLIIPSGIPLPMLQRRDLVRQHPHLAHRLLDPQMYLAGLNAATCRKACGNLASYGWFPGPALPKYDSSKQTLQGWSAKVQASIHQSWLGHVPTRAADLEDSVRSCVDLQAKLACEAIILPAPLTVDPTASYEAELAWLDVGLDIAKRAAPGTPRLATIAISDTCLRGRNPYDNRLLDVVTDQVTARAPDGAYVVIEQANEDGYYCTHPNTIGSLLRIVGDLKAGGLTTVVVAFAGTAGLLALCVGADAWSAGWYRGERRLRLSDFEQNEGRAVPAYYSHASAGEFHCESDLDRVVAGGFLPRISDTTPASQGLLRALARPIPVRNVPEWEHRPSNISAAQEHFMAAICRETQKIGALDEDAALVYADRWLQDAATLAADLYQIGGFNPRTAVNHQHGWLQAFKRFLDARR